MKDDSLRNFTVRFLESALRRVESSAKTFYGGRLSTGEAIRRLAEERLDQIENEQPRETMRSSLLRILREWRSGKSLSIDDLRCIADYVQVAYQRCGRDWVSKDLLVTNVSAFRDAVRLATRGKTSKGIEPEQLYYTRNLSSSGIEARSLVEYIDKWIESLPDSPSPSLAEFASKNLLTFLRSDECPDTPHLDKALAPYLSALLQVAIRGYWYSERQPLVEPRPGFIEPPAMSLGAVRDGKVSISPLSRDHELMLALEFSDRGLVITVNNFVEVEDLAGLTHRAAKGQFSRSETFTWMKNIGSTSEVIFVSQRITQFLSADELASVDRCLQSFLQEPSVKALTERLVFIYGRI